MFRYLGVFSLAILFSVPAVASKTTDEFIFALNACDRGLAMPIPKSSGALSILQLLLKKYRNLSREALAMDANLKDLPTRYEGEVLKSISFAEAYRRCEMQFGEKVRQAEVEVTKQLELRQQKWLEQQRIMEQLAVQKQLSEHHAITAFQHCQTVTATTAAATFAKYSLEKQHALQLYPEIVQHVLPAFGDAKQNVAQKFQYCDQLFARLLPSNEESLTHLSYVTFPYTVELSATLLPPIEFIHAPQFRVPKELLPVPPTVIAIQVSEKATDQPISKTDELYQEWLAKMQGERLKILQQEKRLPDNVNRRDLDYHKATRWQYQKTTASGSEKCVVYSFQNNQQVATKELYGQCQ